MLCPNPDTFWPLEGGHAWSNPDNLDLRSPSGLVPDADILVGGLVMPDPVRSCPDSFGHSTYDLYQFVPCQRATSGTVNSVRGVLYRFLPVGEVYLSVFSPSRALCKGWAIFVLSRGLKA